MSTRRGGAGGLRPPSRLAGRLLVWLTVLGAGTAPLRAAQIGEGASGGQGVSVRADVDRPEITVGDRVTLALTVHHRPGDEVMWPDAADAFGDFEVLEARRLEPVVGEDGVTSRAEFVLTTFQLDEVEIPSIEVVVRRDGGAEAMTAATDPIPVTVASVGRDEGGAIRDIKPPLSMARNLWLLVPWVLALVALGALGYWAYRRYRRRAGAPAAVTAPARPARPAHEVAYEALDRLEAAAPWERGEIKQYFSEASDILRVYLEGRFGIIAMEMTSRDIVEALEAVRLPAGTLDDFDGLLRRCDLVKFAKQRPDAEACRALVPMARSLVDRTREVAAVTDAERTETVSPGVAAAVGAPDSPE